MNAELIHLRLVVFVAVFFWAIISVIILQFVLRPVVNALRTGVDLAKQVSQGDLTAKVEIFQRDEIGELADALRGMVSQLSQMAMTIKTTAEGIAGASNEVNSASQQLSQGASEQASSVEEVSSSMEEMAANIQQTTDNARHSEKVVEKALEEIGKLAHAGNDSLASIKAIAEKINIINDIAFQTNILALNAAVEAARAGEQGKGFAVVTAEVRKLAERSKIAADEIVSLASTSVHYTELASEAMGRVAPEIANTVKLTQEIAAASAEQSAGTDQINSAIQQLNHVTQQNAAASEEMATSAEELSSQAEQLREVIGFFKLDATSTGKSYVKTEQTKIEKKETPSGKPEELKTADEQPKKGIVLKGFSSDTGDTEYEHF
jgi:methyl-accepting chemotaxis protein